MTTGGMSDERYLVLRYLTEVNRAGVGYQHLEEALNEIDRLLARTYAPLPPERVHLAEEATGILEALRRQIAELEAQAKEDEAAFERIASWLQGNDDLRDYPILKDATARLAVRRGGNDG